VARTTGADEQSSVGLLSRFQQDRRKGEEKSRGRLSHKLFDRLTRRGLAGGFEPDPVADAECHRKARSSALCLRCATVADGQPQERWAA
jgi:hypothetical protein